RRERDAAGSCVSATGASGDPLAEVTGRELLAVVDEELHRLPERFRTPLVLCYLQGKTRDEAARQLGSTLATLKRRLEQGRERLRRGLERRGVSLPAALAAICLSSAAVPQTLATMTTRAAQLVASGRAADVSPSVLQLAVESLRGTSSAKWKVLAVAVLVASFVGGGWLTHALPTDESLPVAPTPNKEEPGPAADKNKQVTVSGR